MEWFKMPVDLIDDPVVRTFNDSEYRAWQRALGDACRYERDGLYSFAGKTTTVVKGLIAKGGLIPVASEVEGVETFEVYAWATCIETKEAIGRKRAEAKERKDRYQERVQNTSRTRSESRTNAKGSNSLSTSTSEVVVEGSQPPTSGTKRDLAYEALGDCWQGDWQGLANSARGRINEALGNFRNDIRETREWSDEQLAAEIVRRWQRAEEWQPDWTWTPQTLVTHWNKLGKPERLRRRDQTSIRHQDRAAQIIGGANGQSASDDDPRPAFGSLPSGTDAGQQRPDVVESLG